MTFGARSKTVVRLAASGPWGNQEQHAPTKNRLTRMNWVRSLPSSGDCKRPNIATGRLAAARIKSGRYGLSDGKIFAGDSRLSAIYARTTAKPILVSPPRALPGVAGSGR